LRVNLFILGAMKCGTTSLFGHFEKHPQICFSNPKETGFFKDENWNDKLDIYHKKFNCVNENIKYYAEGDTNYTKFALNSNKNIWDRIFEYNTNAKLIYLYRNPIDRIVSEYTHLILEGYQSGKIEDLVFKKTNYIQNSSYYSQIYPFIQKFGEENIRLISFETFIKNRSEILNEISGFLGIEPFKDAHTQIHKNKSSGNLRFHHKWRPYSRYFKKLIDFLPKTASDGLMKILIPKERHIFEKPSLTQNSKQKIVDLLENDIVKFEALIGKNLDHWKQP